MPITLTPEQVASFVPDAPPAAAPVPEAVSAPITLTPEQVAAFVPDAQQPQPPQGGVDVLREFSVPQLLELVKQNPSFNLADAFRADPTAQRDQTIVNKLSDAYHELRMQPWYTGVPVAEGIATGDLGKTAEGVKTLGTTVASMVGGGVKYAGNVAEVLGGQLGSAAENIFGLGTEASRKQHQLEIQQKAAESLAATELAVTGLTHLPGQVAGAVGRATGLAKPLAEYTPQEKQEAFLNAVGKSQIAQETAAGHGPFLGMVAGETVKSLEAAKMPVRPEESTYMAGGDPLSFMLFGAGMKGVTTAAKVAGRGAELAAGGVVDLTGQAENVARASAAMKDILNKIPSATDIGGKAVEAAGVAGQGASYAAGKVSPIAGAAVGSTVAAHLPIIGELPIPGLSHVAGALQGWRAGKTFGQSLFKLGEQFKGMSQAGKNIASGAITGSYEQLAQDVLQAAPASAKALAHGAAFDLGLAASMETPQERQSVGVGVAFGLLGGALKTTQHAVSGQIIAPREFAGIATPIPGSGAFPSLEAMSRGTFESLTPGQKVRLNATKEFLKSANPKADMFVGADPAQIQAALESLGYPPETAAEWSQQRAMTFTHEGRKIAIVSKDALDAAPHEARHAMENVIGEDSMRQLDQEIISKYPVDQIGKAYADRMTQSDTGDAWVEHILDGTGTGNREAMEKVIQDMTAQFNDEARKAGNEPPTPSEIRTLVENQLKTEGVDWRNIFTPEEAKASAQRYIAREIAAENFDSWFKHTGGTGVEGKQIPEVLARWMGSVAETFGINPVADRASADLKIPLSPTVVKDVANQAKALRPVVEPAAAPVKAGPVGIPRTPEERAAAATDAADLARTAPDTIVAGGTKTQREILGIAAEAIANQGAVKLNYLSAPEEPAASIASKRNVRREMIEAYRTMPPEARKLWEKTFFPEKVVRLKNGQYQVSGWAPEVFAANAHKLAKVMNENTALAALSPYELDPATGSFSRTGWLDLYHDVEQFVKNQQAGFTGSGVPLNVPGEVQGKGFFKPPQRTGQELALDQTRADFVNMLFGFKLPTTATLGHGKFPLNVAGQEISKATVPGRLVEPLVPRPEFAGKKAEALGVAGRKVLEVNPIRDQLTRLAGDKMPSFIEAFQNLNLENIKEAEHAPEAPQFRGNTLTLSAGFSPKEKPEISQFLPADPNKDIEQIKEAAYEMPDGKILSGPTHSHAFMKGEKQYPDEAWASAKDGFVTTKGRFVSRDEALDIALQAEQMYPEDYEAATTNQTLESVAFRKAQMRHENPELAQFAAKNPGNRKVKEDFNYKLKEGPGMFSKAWIAPDGTPIQLGGQWHHEWVNANPAEAKKYGLKATTSGEENRVDALKAGFARVNYGKNNGTLTVEARKQDWEKLMPSVRKFVEANLDKIDNMDVHLLDAKAKKIVESDGVALFTYDRNEKMDNLPLISAPSQTTEMSAQATPGALHSEHVQYLPGGDPRAIRQAAIRDRDNGKIYEGFAHYAARQEAMKDGYGVSKLMNFEDGFMTNSGEFLNREEAFKRATELNQYKPTNARGAAGQPDRAKKLESVAFERQQELVKMGYEPDVQFTPKYQKKDFDVELEKVRTGANFGQTFNKDGSVWEVSKKSPTDIVTLASVNLPKADLTRENVMKALGPYGSLLDEKGTALGVFSMPDGERVSVDVNALPPQKYRENSVDFAKRNNQVSIWDPVKGEEVKTGGNGETVITDPQDALDAIHPLLKGKPPLVPDAATEAKAAEYFKTGKPLPSTITKQLTRAQKARIYPESVIPKSATAVVKSDIKNSPLAKQAGSEEAAVKAFSDKLVEFAEKYKDSPEYQEGLKWYSDFVPKLKAEFGEHAQMFAELLAATSPRNKPLENFQLAMEALEQFKTGKFDTHIRKFHEGLNMLEDGSWKNWFDEQQAAKKIKKDRTATEPAFMAEWIKIHDLQPRKSNDKLYGMHSTAVLKVLSRAWLQSVEGPKVSNFIQNLIGEGHGATIDVWAQRTMRRLGYEGFQDRWRILPGNEAAVTDPDFFFSQKAFADAAGRLGVLPDALQGGLWFAEKKLWQERNWGRLDLGSYLTELKKADKIREGISQRMNPVITKRPTK